MVRKGDWKLIKYYEDNSFELFNLKTDVSETTNFAVHNPLIVKKLDKEHSHWLKATGAKLPIQNSAYKSK